MAAKEFVTLSKLQLFLTKTKTLIAKKQDKQSVVAGTMSASKWNGGKYSFESTYPASSYDLDICPSDAATADQVSAFGAAMLVGSVSTNVLTAKGTVPTVDIPIVIKVVKK